jgi:hypothetical protein
MRIIDAKHNQAIRREIGERLQGFLRVQPDVPRTFASLSVNSKVIIGLSGVRTFLPGSMRA